MMLTRRCLLLYGNQYEPLAFVNGKAWLQKMNLLIKKEIIATTVITGWSMLIIGAPILVSRSMFQYRECPSKYGDIQLYD